MSILPTTFRNYNTSFYTVVVRRFWSTLQGWLLNNFGLRMLLTGKNIMFPSERRGGLTNYLYVVAKYYIYANKFSGYELHIESF